MCLANRLLLSLAEKFRGTKLFIMLTSEKPHSLACFALGNDELVVRGPNVPFGLTEAFAKPITFGLVLSRARLGSILLASQADMLLRVCGAHTFHALLGLAKLRGQAVALVTMAMPIATLVVPLRPLVLLVRFRRLDHMPMHGTGAHSSRWDVPRR